MSQVSDFVHSSIDRLDNGLSARSSTAIRVGQTVGLALAGFCAGSMGAASLTLIPTISTASAGEKPKLWLKAFNNNKVVMPATEAVVGAIFGWLALKANHSLLPRLSLPLGFSISFTGAYAVAAATSVAVLPVTFALLYPTNRRLLTAAGVKSSTLDDDGPAPTAVEVDELLTAWQIRNGIRAAIVTTGAVLATWASINWPSWKRL